MSQRKSRRSIYAPLRVLVYSDNAKTRHLIELALGQDPEPRLPPIDFIEVATQATVMRQMASGGVDVAILDGEASPAGGLGTAKQLKDELLLCPPIVIIVGREEDMWLAKWSRADAVVPRPIDPFALVATVVPLLRSRLIA